MITKYQKALLKYGFLFLWLVSCTSIETPLTSTTVAIPSTETLAPQQNVRQNEITLIWERGRHAIAAEPVRCESCHELQNGIVLENSQWPNSDTGQSEARTNHDALCGKCHRELVGGKAHHGFSCTNCHDPHNTYSSCTASGCHSNMQTIHYEVPPTPTDGHPNAGSSFCGGSNCHSVATAVANNGISIHGSSHASIPCMVCHDASGLVVQPADNGNEWRLWQAVVMDDGGVIFERASSHTLQASVDCRRCHFEENPWGLYPVTGTEFRK